MITPLRRLVLSSVVTIALFGGCGSATPTASVVPSPVGPTATAAGRSPSGPASAAAGTPSPSASPTPAPSVSPITAGWQRVWPGPAEPHRLLSAIVALDAGFLVTGADAATQAPTAMTSTDGLAWSAEAVPGKDVHPSKLVAWGDRVLGVGTGQVPCAHPFGLDAWVRSAGGGWAEAPFDDLFCRASDVSLAIVGGRAVLAGSGPGDSADAWSSVDGLHWADHSQTFTGLLPRAVAADGSTAAIFAAGPTGTWVSTSTDGSHWSTPAMIPGLPTDLVIDGAFWLDGAPTLVVSEGAIVGSIRPDGQGGWQRAKAEGIAADQLQGISAFDGGLLAVAGDTTVRAWVSGQGLTWRPVTLPDDLSATGANVAGVAVRGDRSVLIGSLTDAAGNPASAIWTGPASLVRP